MLVKFGEEAGGGGRAKKKYIRLALRDRVQLKKIK